MSDTQIEMINSRLGKLEKQNFQDLLLLLEIMSSATFFGEMKKNGCKYAKGDQCSFFFLKTEAKNKIPIATDCKISNCKDMPGHCHLELSNLTCTLCPVGAQFSKLKDCNCINSDESVNCTKDNML